MIPRELNREMYVSIETETIDVWETPSIVDAVILSGVPPEPHPDTMYYAGFDALTNILTIRTGDDKTFDINNATQRDVEP